MSALRLRIFVGTAALMACLLVPITSIAQDFSDAYLGDIAESYADSLTEAARDDTVPTGRLLAVAGKAAQNGDWRIARRNMERLVPRTPSNASEWLRLAQAWRASEPTDQRGAAAAYQAYILATPEEAKLDALFILGDLLFEIWSQQSRADVVAADIWRDISKRVFAEIGQAVQDDELISKRISRLAAGGMTLQRQGLFAHRRLGGGTPPVCAAFSENLTTDLDQIKRYVSIYSPDGGSAIARQATLSVDGRELCATNVAWGYTYVLVIQEGLPAANGLALNKTVEVKTEVPAAPPSIGFKQRDYVLARNGTGLVSLKSVNVTSAQLTLYRISDRTFLRSIILDDIPAALNSTKLNEISSKLAEQIWNGRSELGQQLNTEHTALVPAGQIIDDWESAARALAPKLPDPAFGAYVEFDASRPEKAKRLGPAAYALVVDDTTIPPLGDIKRGESQKEYYAPTRFSGASVQWIVRSDLGISLMTSERSVHAVVRSITDGSAITDATIEILAKSGRILGTATTDSNGTARFERRILRGKGTNAFRAVVAYSEDDFGYLLANAPSLNLTDLDVSGRTQGGPVDVSVTLERQIYRPGETVQALLLARAPDGSALKVTPGLQVKIESETGMIAGSKRIGANDALWKANGLRLEMPLQRTVPIGPAKLTIRMPGDDAILGEARIQIRNFKPERARMRLENAWSATSAGTRVNVSGAAMAQYLFGATQSSDGAILRPVKNARVDAWLNLEPTTSPHAECYLDYAFGHADETPAVLQRRVTDILQTDTSGRVQIDSFISGVPEATRPRQIVPTVHLVDDTGVITRFTPDEPIPLREDREWFGIRQTPNNNAAKSGKLSFDVISLNSELAKSATVLDVRLLRETTSFIWSGSTTGWDYHPSVQRTPVDQEIVSINASFSSNQGCETPEPVTFNLPADGTSNLGAYRVELRNDKGEVLTSMRFQVGGAIDPLKPEKPQFFPVQLSEGTVRSGDRLDLAATSLPFDTGTVEFAFVMGGDVIHWHSADIKDAEASFGLDVPDSWDGGFIHVLATAYRGLADGLPGSGRSVGLTSFRVDSSQRRFVLNLDAPRDALPTEPVTIRLRAEGLPNGRDAYAMVFATDEGIHQITKYQARDPFDFFHGRRKFPFEIKDMYANLITAEEGERLGENGGDLFEDFRGAGYDSTALASQMIGPVRLENGIAEIQLTPFEFSGLIRLAAIAWTQDSTGFIQSKTGLDVFDSLDLNLGAPQHAMPGDRLSLSTTFRNMLDQIGQNYRIIVSVEGARLANDAVFKTDQFSARAGQTHVTRAEIVIPDDASGEVQIKAIAQSLDSDAQDIVKTATIQIGRPRLPQMQVFHLGELRSGESRAVDQNDISNVVQTLDGINEASVTFLARNSVRLPSTEEMFADLDEDARDLQGVAARGVVALALGLGESNATDHIQKLSALQTPDGGFMPTPVRHSVAVLGRHNSSDGRMNILGPIWRAAIGVDYLQYAEVNGVPVDADVMRTAVGFIAGSLRRFVSSFREEDPEVCRREVYFAALVLARADAIDRPSFERIHRCTNNADPDFENALLAAFLLAYGETESANELLASAFPSSGFRQASLGSNVLSSENLYMILALLAENQAPERAIEDAAQYLVRNASATPLSLDLRAGAWMARAEESLARLFPRADVQLDVKGRNVSDSANSNKSVWLSKSFKLSRERPSFAVENIGRSNVDLYALVRGPRLAHLGPPEGAVSLRRRLFTVDGEEILDGSSAKIKQNDLLVFLIEGLLPTEVNDPRVRIAVPLPSGFVVEISYIQESALKSILGPSTGVIGEPVYFEDQHDRLLTIVDADAENPSTASRFRYAFIARASIAGELTVGEALGEVLENTAIAGVSGTMNVVIQPGD